MVYVKFRFWVLVTLTVSLYENSEQKMSKF
jgi:hypothetical protein